MIQGTDILKYVKEIIEIKDIRQMIELINTKKWVVISGTYKDADNYVISLGRIG